MIVSIQNVTDKANNPRCYKNLNWRSKVILGQLRHFL